MPPAFFFFSFIPPLCKSALPTPLSTTSAVTMPTLSTARLRPTSSDLLTAASLLRSNHLVAFPTETVYGLGANALSTTAVEAIYAAKRRPSDNPLIVHVASLSALSTHNLTPPPSSLVKRLAAAFWPGPLTLVLPLHPQCRVSSLVTAGLSTIAVRVPSHETALQLLRLAEVPVAAPSANLSGRPSPTTAQHVLADLDGAISAVVEGCVCEVGVESTVVDVSTDTPGILRMGKITAEQLHAATGVVFTTEKGSGTSESDDAVVVERPKAPGMKYRHYAPRGKVVLLDREQVADEVWRREARGESVGVVVGGDLQVKNAKAQCFRCGDGDADSFARDMYAGLRWFDGEGGGEQVDVILVVPPEQSGVGVAVMERLTKAAAAHT